MRAFGITGLFSALTLPFPGRLARMRDANPDETSLNACERPGTPARRHLCFVRIRAPG